MPDGHPHKTLIVDDDASLLDALANAFQEAGEHVVALGSFEEARRVLQTEQFDALVTDIRLGEFNGLQLAVMCRHTNPDMRIVVFSGFDDCVLRSEADHVRADYLVKPVSGAKLLELLRQERTD